MPTYDIQLAEEANLSLLPANPTSEDLSRFADCLMQVAEEQGEADVPTTHTVDASLYTRSIHIPAGTWLAGLPHKHDHINICVGDITVWTEAGRKRITGAHIIPATAGTQRIGYTHEATTWVTVHRNDTGGTDIGVIEEALVHHAEKLQTRRRAIK